MGNELERAREIVALVGDDEGLARGVRYELADRFGWTYCAMGRDDVESNACRRLTDEEWDKVRYSKVWRDVMPDQMADGASITFLLDDLGIRSAEEGDPDFIEI